MYCGQCCVTEARLRAAPQLDIFIEILLGTSVNKRVAPRCLFVGDRGGGRKVDVLLPL
jgi:hypothetical protein